MRLGIPKGVIEKVQPAVRENFEASIAVLGEVADVTRDVEWPDFPWGPAVSAIVGAEGAAAFLDLIESGRVKELKCPKCRFGAVSEPADSGGRLPPGDAAARADEARGGRHCSSGSTRSSRRRASTVAYPADKNFEDVYPGISGGPPLIPAGNLCGLPALAIPNGFGENGLPTSLSFMGPAFSEGDLIALANAYQERSDWHTQVPRGV